MSFVGCTAQVNNPSLLVQLKGMQQMARHSTIVQYIRERLKHGMIYIIYYSFNIDIFIKQIFDALRSASSPMEIVKRLVLALVRMEGRVKRGAAIACVTGSAKTAPLLPRPRHRDPLCRSTF